MRVSQIQLGAMGITFPSTHAEILRIQAAQNDKQASYNCKACPKGIPRLPSKDASHLGTGMMRDALLIQEVAKQPFAQFDSTLAQDSGNVGE